MLRRFLVLVLAILISATLWGCGSNRDSKSISGGGDDLGNDPDSGIAYVGADVCIGCHEGFSWSAEAVDKYLDSKHVLHSTHIDAASGDCLQCHDPIGDGPTIEDLIDPDYVPANGLAAVTCEACHGAGGQHSGIGPMPDPNPNYEVCGTCHNEIPESHIPHHPFANNILDNFKKSAHYMVDPDTGENDARDGEPCFRCHSDEGYRDYIGITEGLDADELEVRLAGIADLPVATTVQCRTCHDSHSGELRASETTERVRVNGETLDPRPVSFSREFNLCTNCHQAFLEATEVIITDDEADPGEEESFGYFEYILDNSRRVYHDTSNSRIIVDTHFYDPDNGIEGYNINASQDNACSQCHDVHGATKFEQVFAGGIAVEWGETPGFHGDYTSEAFTHSFSNPVCMECHNGSEFVKVVEGLSPDSLTLGDARVVACGSCHDLQAMNDDDEFELGETREVEEFAFPYYATFQEENVEQYPDLELVTVDGLGDNALCMTCHSGRSSKLDVDNATPGSDGTYRFVNIHYRAAGASLFGNIAKGGYEYDGNIYASKFEHVESNDLCVECHNVHSGELFFTDPGFGPTGCVNCHAAAVDVAGVRDIRMIASVADYDGDGDTSEGIYYEVDTLKDDLQKVLEGSGVTILDGYPYFGNITTEAQLRAAYNLQVASKDPGSWAHNPSYTIQLLVDSLTDMGQTAHPGGDDYVRDDIGHFDAEAEAFRHWDLAFDDEAGEFEDGSVSSSCNKCHSSEGGAYFLDNGVAKTTYDNTYTNGISSGLACETCHSSNTMNDGVPVGEARIPDTVTFPSGEVQDLNNTSNICMTCHQGRESGKSIDEAIADNPSGPYSFINVHYFPAAATFFGSGVNGGYEYSGMTYNGQWSHTSSRADCEGCHVNQAPEHDFILVTPTSSCGCHGDPVNDFTSIRLPSPGVDYDGDGDVTEGIYGEIWGVTDPDNTHPADAASIVGAAYAEIEEYAATVIGVPIQYDAHSYPYYFKLGEISYGNRYVDFDAALLKAAYNYQMVQKDPGGYIHNAHYHLQLLIDSIQDLGGDVSGYTRP